jgi:hypothetical protein
LHGLEHGRAVGEVARRYRFLVHGLVRSELQLRVVAVELARLLRSLAIRQLARVELQVRQRRDGFDVFASRVRARYLP